MLDAQRLAVLVEVAHTGSIAGAAVRLACTPSAASQQLAKLERDLGCRLVQRGPRGVSLTEVGRTLLGHAETVVGELRGAEEVVRRMLDEQPKQLSVGAFATAGQTVVPQALARFRRTHPSVALTLQDVEPPDGYGLVSARELDLLITHRYPGVPLPATRGLRRRLLLRDPLRLVLPAGHPMAGSRDVAMQELSDEEWISGADGVPNRVCLHRLAGAAGIRPRVAYETHDYQVTLALVEAGLGIALVPASLLSRAGPELAIREPRDVAPVVRVYLVHHRHPGPLVTDMISRFHQQCGH